jgi:hypothetical protein
MWDDLDAEFAAADFIQIKLPSQLQGLPYDAVSSKSRLRLVALLMKLIW